MSQPPFKGDPNMIPGTPPDPHEMHPKTKMERAYLALSAANQGVWDWDLAKKRVYVSAQYMAMLGYPRQASVLKPDEWVRFMHPEDAESAWRAIVDHMENRSTSYEAEVRHRTRDGGWIWMLDRGRVVSWDPHGNPVRLVGTLADITMRKMMEQAVQKSEERWRQLFDKTNDAIFVQKVEETGRPGKITEVNEVACRMLGYERQDIIGMPGAEVPTRLGLKAFKSGPGTTAHQNESNLIAKDGRRVFVEVKSHTFDLQGSLTSLSIARDISWRRQAEKELRESQERYSAAFKAQPDALVITTLAEGRLVEANEHFYRIMGLAPAEALGRTTVELGLWRDIQHRGKLTGSMESLGRCDNLYLDFINHAGRKKHVLISARGLSIGGGNFLLSILRDISEEVQLSRFQRVILEAADAMGVGIGVFRNRKEGNGPMVYCNQALASMLGMDKSRLINNLRLDEFTLKEDRPRFESFLASRSGNLGAFSVVQCQLASESGAEVLARVVAATTEIDEEPAIVLFCQDISEERRMAKRLEHSQKMESIGTLASGIAHDFNNILTIVMGFTQAAKNELLEGKRPLEDLDEVLNACRRARDLVKQMLTFGRAREGDRRLMNLEPMLKSFLKFIRASLPTNIEIDCQAPKRDAFILADPTQVQQILLNLCTNAAQAMDPGPGELRIRLNQKSIAHPKAREYPELSPGEYIELVVEDTGRGMEPGTLERIFEPFFTTKNRGEGTGLGLSVVHGIVISLGGAVRVWSEPGRGTVFTLLLPAADSGAEPALAVEKRLQRPPGGKEKVLLVDDEPSLLAAVSANLVSLGYRVRSHTSSQEALNEFIQNPQAFDLVISDYSMPGLSGADLTRSLLMKRPDLAIVLCTGYGREAREMEDALPDNVKWLSKPFGLEELARAIGEALTARHQSPTFEEP